MWDGAAAGWARQRDRFDADTEPISEAMLAALEPRPGERLLELAGGPGGVGFRAAQAVLPGGTLLFSDQSQAMVDAARSTAEALGLTNVEFRVLDGEWIDLPLAALDGALCRFGYMLMSDPGAALRETRRVLRPGGRVVFAVWDAVEQNPWSAIPAAVLAEHGLGAPWTPGEPGPFALGEEDLLRALLADAGFLETSIETVEIHRRGESFDAWWATHLDLSARTLAAFMAADEARTEAVEAALVSRLAAFTDSGGAIAVPGRALVARAEA